MKLFRRKKINAGFSRHDALANRVANRIILLQTQVADYLNRKTAYWSKASKLVALFLFCLLFGGSSLYLIIKAFY
jgi:hypothetical protein